jgi:hypothetical protein
MRHFSKTIYWACAALFLVGMSAQASFIIDHFDPPPAGQFVCDPTTPGECDPAFSSMDTWTTATDDYSQDQVLGGKRFLQVSAGTVEVVSASAGGGTSLYAFSSNTGAAGWGYVLWDGAQYTDPTYNLPKDFTEGGANSRIEVTAGGDLGGGYLTVAVNGVESSRLITAQALQNYTFNFSDFVGVDFTNVTEVAMGINGAGGLFTDAPANYDASVHFLEVTGDQVIPEPATLTLIGAGLLALGFFRKRLA